MRVNFSATEDQVKSIAALAVNASKPMGMGFIHFQDREYLPEEFDVAGGVHLDYCDGRMVKLSITKEQGCWSIDDRISIDYESWMSTYPTVQDLLLAAGVKILPE